MQLGEAKLLRQKWEQQGNKPCKHPAIEKEFYQGMHTMDFVCTSCGREFTFAQQQAIEQERRPN